MSSVSSSFRHDPAAAAETPVVNRLGPLLIAEKSRVILRRMYPSSHEKARSIVDRVIGLSAEKIKEELSVIMDDWSDRHDDLEHWLHHRFREVAGNISFSPDSCDDNAKLLIGAFFSNEYSIEAAALFNPSIVPHPDQTDVADGQLRFVMSLRATGEGHISSVSFREGVIASNNRISLKASDAKISDAKRVDDILDKERFVYEVKHTHGLTRTWAVQSQGIFTSIVQDLPDKFSLDDLRRKCSRFLSEAKPEEKNDVDNTVQALLLLAEANYSVSFDENTSMSQRVLFPSAPSQSNGIEDARFVQFTQDDGEKIYYATFTAYNGRSALPQLIETTDMTKVRFISLSGNAITNKGMALFPRKIGGKFWMLGRQDDESIMILSSNSILHWDNPAVLMRPEQPWEMFKMGNCGSPLETPKGWLVLTHGVGAMRRYCIGVALLALDDPTKVIGRMSKPLIAPNESEREGYVPNVVYSCGAILHKGSLIIPYAMSDSATSFAAVHLDELFAAMLLPKE